MGGLRSGITSSVLRAALVWATVGTCVAAVICFVLVGPFSVFVLVDAGPGALALGVIEALWLFVEKSRAANSQQFTRLGLISGAGLGILALPPALARTDLSSNSWIFAAVLFIAAVLGGGVGGVFSAKSFRIGITSRETSHSTLRHVAVCCLIFVPLGLAEYYYYGPIVQAKLVVLNFLPKHSVMSLPAGNAQGSRWTGCYAFEYRNIGGSGVGGGELHVTQSDGRLTIEEGRDTFDGGIDSNGRFWVGRDVAYSDFEGRFLWEGKFINDSRVQVSIRTTSLENGVFANSGLAKGTGYRVPCP
jgi:hypothetical protein